MKDNPNLFLELVAWRQLGFNGIQNPSATTNGYREIFSNKHTLAPNVGAGGFNDSKSTENNERHVFTVGSRLKLEQ